MNKLKNIWQHPVTTVFGILGGAFLATAHYANWHSFGAALALALLGALAKEN